MLERLLQLVEPVFRFKSHYKKVARVMHLVTEVERILEPEEDKTSESVRFEMACFLDWMHLTYNRPSDVPIVKNIQSYTKGFWKGLFTCYDEYHIPRTNNDLEHFFRATKAGHRRTTGLRNWNRYIMRHGEMIVLVSDALKQEHLLSRLRSVPYTTYRQQMTEWSERLKQQTLQKRFRRDPLQYLRDLEQKWKSTSVS